MAILDKISDGFLGKPLAHRSRGGGQGPTDQDGDGSSAGEATSPQSVGSNSGGAKEGLP